MPEPRTGASASGSWPTPSASLGEHAGLVTPSKAREGGTLVEAMSARIWPTPTTDSATARTKRYAQGGMPLAAAVAMWPSPMAADARGSSGQPGPRKQVQLTDAVRMWASPASRAFRSGKGRQDNGHTPQLPEQVGGVLNPAWVETLMGFPPGWTDIAA